MFSYSEPLVLGLSSGLACLTSCGALLFPWLSAEKRTLSHTVKTLFTFLGGRLVGYMGFAMLSWGFGWFLARHAAFHSWVLGGAHLIVAVILFVYALSFFGEKEDPDAAIKAEILRQSEEGEEPSASQPVAVAKPKCGPSRSIWPWSKSKGSAKEHCSMLISPGMAMTLQRRLRLSAPFMLGFLTGMNICPPFLVAMLRVADGTTLVHALAFFFFFFVGTLPWFLPCLVSAPLQKIPGLIKLARAALFLLSFYYAYVAVRMLWQKMSCGSCTL